MSTTRKSNKKNSAIAETALLYQKGVALLITERGTDENRLTIAKVHPRLLRVTLDMDFKEMDEVGSAPLGETVAHLIMRNGPEEARVEIVNKYRVLNLGKYRTLTDVGILDDLARASPDGPAMARVRKLRLEKEINQAVLENGIRGTLRTLHQS